MSQSRAEDMAAATRPRVGTIAALVTYLGVLLAAVGLDLLTKQLALTHLSDGTEVRLLGGALYFDLTRNSGAAFSIGTSYTIIFPIVAMIVVAAITVLALRLRSVPFAISLGLIAGGAAGNLLDRLFRAPSPFRGHVVDFISVFGPDGERFPIFNVADSALFCGVVLVILLEFVGPPILSRAVGGRGARKTGAEETDAGDVGARQARAGDMGARQARAGDMGARQARADEDPKQAP